MPAIQTARLRQQSALLADHFNDPQAYIRSLHYLLDFYADRAKRPSQLGQPRPLIEAYQVHPPVLKFILRELVPLAQNDPEKGFMLCDALWKEPFLECRLLASMLIGQMPTETAEKVIECIQRWITSDLEIQLVDAIITHGFLCLRREYPHLLLNLIQNWLNNSEIFYQQVGLRALLPFINDAEFENIPAFFGMLQPFTVDIPNIVRPDLLEVFTALARRSPQETAYFLRQCLRSPEAINTPWLIRQIVHQFPPDLQKSLRHSIRNTRIMV